MHELIDTNPNLDVQEDEFKRLLGYPENHELKGRARELADWTRQWYNENGKPWIYASKVDDLDFAEGKLKIGGTELASRKFRDMLKQGYAFCAMIVIASAGEECEKKAHQYWIEGKPDEYFFLEVYGSAVVEHLVVSAGAKFCYWAEENSLSILPHYSPGYPGWEVTDQKHLFNLIKFKSGQKLPGVLEVFETGMLYPKKSMFAVFGISKSLNIQPKLSELIPCQSCAMFSCGYRKIPYKKPPRQVENISQLQPQKRK